MTRGSRSMSFPPLGIWPGKKVKFWFGLLFGGALHRFVLTHTGRDLQHFDRVLGQGAYDRRVAGVQWWFEPFGCPRQPEDCVEIKAGRAVQSARAHLRGFGNEEVIRALLKFQLRRAVNDLDVTCPIFEDGNVPNQARAWLRGRI